MRAYSKPSPSILVIFGGAGDLTCRKLIPAMYNLYVDKLLPEHLAIVGIDRKPMSDDDYRLHLREGIDRFSRRGKTDAAVWKDFAPQITYISGDANAEGFYADLRKGLDEFDRRWNLAIKWNIVSQRIFYLAVPPDLVGPITTHLGKAQLAGGAKRNRVVVEKPFGHDLASAKALNEHLTEIFSENQIFRIDHYLGKETVQNILAFRFANTMYEPIWNRRYIDHVQITVSEQLGVGHRGGYYEHAGALRDMVQNHLSQVLCLIAMEPPVSYKADEIRNKKVDVLNAIRPIPPDQMHQFAVRGQYDHGWIRGKRVAAYRSESGVDGESNVETFAAVKYFVDNWRWQGVPFYLRTGKRLPIRVSNVTIQFRPVPHLSFPQSAIPQPQPNRLTIRVQPEEGIIQRFLAKQPGEAMHLSPVDMKFSYKDSFQTSPPEAYETLLLDVMLGDTTQFMRADQLEAAWSIIMPILEAWEYIPPIDFPNYSAGTWGPEAAEVLIAQDGRSWVLPAFTDTGEYDEAE